MPRLYRIEDPNVRAHLRWALKQVLRAIRRRDFTSAEMWAQYADGMLAVLFITTPRFNAPASYHRVRAAFFEVGV